MFSEKSEILSPRPSLEEQFEHPEKSTGLSIYDLQPEHLKTEVPTTVIPGWSLTPKTIQQLLLSLAREKRRILAYDAPHGIENKSAPKGLSDTQTKKIAALFETLDEKGVGKTDILGISEGGIYASLAASLQPERFRNLVLVESAGLIKEADAPRIVASFSSEAAQDVLKSFKNPTTLKTALKALGGVAKSVGLHTRESASELVEISNAEIHEILEELRSKGVKVTMIHGVDDKTFPMSKVQESVARKQVDAFYSIRGSHNSFIFEPEKIAMVIDEALDAMEKRDTPPGGTLR